MPEADWSRGRRAVKLQEAIANADDDELRAEMQALLDGGQRTIVVASIPKLRKPKPSSPHVAGKERPALPVTRAGTAEGYSTPAQPKRTNRELVQASEAAMENVAKPKLRLVPKLPDSPELEGPSIAVPTKALLERAAEAKAFSAGRASLPVLAGVRLNRPPGDRLWLESTDLEYGYRAAVDVEGKPVVTFDVVVPADTLVRALRASKQPWTTLTYDKDKGTVTIATGGAAFALRTLSAEDFPKLGSGMDEVAIAKLDAAAFADAFRRAFSAASKDEARPILTGVLLETNDGALGFTTTDSWRMLHTALDFTDLRPVPRGQDAPDGFRLVVAARRAKSVAAVLEREGGDVIVKTNESSVRFCVGFTQVTIRCIEGEFPNWRQLVPEDQPNHLTVDREAFLEAVRRVGILAQQGTPVRLELGSSGVRLTAGTQDVGEVGDLLEGTYDGEPLTIAFNAGYLSDGLHAIDGSEVVLSCRDGLKPAVLRSPSGGLFYLLMPVRI